VDFRIERSCDKASVVEELLVGPSRVAAEIQISVRVDE
jgi:hypothetical protein